MKKKGYQILDKNYSPYYISGPKKGDVDIIAKKRDVISFLEVKTLRDLASLSFLPEDKVNFQKQKKLIKTTEAWPRERKISFPVKWQIDIIDYN